jgi:hypothetical protein
LQKCLLVMVWVHGRQIKYFFLLIIRKKIPKITKSGVNTLTLDPFPVSLKAILYH